MPASPTAMRAAIPHLTRRPEFLRVAGTGRKAVFPGLILQAVPQPTGAVGVPPRRIGYTASRKVGNAVARNRSKRRLRAACDALMVLHAAGGHDYVLIAREATAARPWLMLLDDLKRAMKKLGVWRDPTLDGGPAAPVDAGESVGLRGHEA